MLEKIVDAFERIATALERIAAYAGTAAPKSTPAADKPAPAGKRTSAPKEDAPSKTEFSGRPSSESTIKDPPADDGLGDDAITFEQMREKLISVKQHAKLGPTKSSALLTKYGKLPDIKESDYPKLVAECDKLLKSVA